jgi:hypothetical protein
MAGASSAASSLERSRRRKKYEVRSTKYKVRKPYEDLKAWAWGLCKSALAQVRTSYFALCIRQCLTPARRSNHRPVFFAGSRPPARPRSLRAASPGPAGWRSPASAHLRTWHSAGPPPRLALARIRRRPAVSRLPRAPQSSVSGRPRTSPDALPPARHGRPRPPRTTRGILGSGVPAGGHLLLELLPRPRVFNQSRLQRLDRGVRLGHALVGVLAYLGQPCGHLSSGRRLLLLHALTRERRFGECLLERSTIFSVAGELAFELRVPFCGCFARARSSSARCSTFCSAASAAARRR